MSAVPRGRGVGRAPTPAAPGGFASPRRLEPPAGHRVEASYVAPVRSALLRSAPRKLRAGAPARRIAASVLRLGSERGQPDTGAVPEGSVDGELLGGPEGDPGRRSTWAEREQRGCGVGYGTRGGTSRGEGAGSRYLKVICRQPGCGYQVRVTRKWLALCAPRCPAHRSR